MCAGEETMKQPEAEFQEYAAIFICQVLAPHKSLSVL